MQCMHADNDRRERRRNLRVAHVGPVLLAIHDESVNRRVERFLNLGCGSREFEDGPAGRDRGNLKTMLLEPGRDDLNVLIGGAVQPAELLR